jgi:hypothetical protein
MKFKDIIAEQKIQEAPMGLLKTVGNKALSKISSKAAGKLETGTTANQLYTDFKKYLGKTGQEPSREVVLSFLQSKGLPTAGAEAAIDKAGEPSAVGVAAKAAAGDAVDAVSGAVKKGADKLKQAFAKKPAAQAAAGDQRQDPGMDNTAVAATAPGQRQDPTMDNPAPAAKSGFAQGNYQSANYGSSAGFDKTSMKNVSNPMPTGAVGGVPTGQSNLPQPTTATTPAATPAGRTQGGGKVKGQLSQSTSAVRRRQQRANRANTSSALGQFVNTQTGKNPVSMARKESIEYNFDMLMEALEISQQLHEAPLSRGQIEKAFMAAVQDSAKIGGGQQPAAQQGGGGSSDAQQGGGGQQQGGGGSQQGGGGQQPAAQQGGGGGFIAGLMGKGDGKVKGNFNVNQLAQLLQVDPKELSAAIVKLKQGQPLSRTHITTLSNAFVGLYKADPQSTVQAANMLKKVSAA